MTLHGEQRACAAADKRKAVLRVANKYGACKVEIDGYTFASKLEAARYRDLQLTEKAGEIIYLGVHPCWALEVNHILIGHYTPDFSYYRCEGGEPVGRIIVEDVKGVRTRDYILRKKLMKAIHQIDVQEYPPKPPRAPARRQQAKEE
jgi:hypothetical protein